MLPNTINCLDNTKVDPITFSLLANLMSGMSAKGSWMLYTTLR